MPRHFLTTRSLESTPRGSSQSDLQAPTHPGRKRLSGRQKVRYMQDTASLVTPLAAKKHIKHKKPIERRCQHSSFVLFVPFCGYFSKLRMLEKSSVQTMSPCTGCQRSSFAIAPSAES